MRNEATPGLLGNYGRTYPLIRIFRPAPRLNVPVITGGERTIEMADQFL